MEVCRWTLWLNPANNGALGWLHSKGVEDFSPGSSRIGDTPGQQPKSHDPVGVKDGPNPAHRESV